MAAMDPLMITPEANNRGFLPNLSTTNNDEILLTNCTSPTIIDARWPSTELPAVLKISTVKKMTESIPLNCWIIRSTNPIISGIRTVLLQKALSSKDLYIFGVVTLSLVAIKSVNFNHCADCSASSYLFLDLSQTGDSGSDNTITKRQLDTINPSQASQCQESTLPIT